MTKFISQHNDWINEIEILISNHQFLPENTLDYHERKVSYLQHERLIHLLVLIFVGIVLITLFVTSLFVDITALYILLIVIGILFFLYIKHYYLLENTVQKWYDTTEQIIEHNLN